MILAGQAVVLARLVKSPMYFAPQRPGNRSVTTQVKVLQAKLTGLKRTDWQPETKSQALIHWAKEEDRSVWARDNCLARILRLI